ncbi:MAG TPA: FAD-binding oxidoreductase [Gemmatimonadaceae bacterium]|nr:FAD-binding oxidoreductase [Gemmatimonadaceae bacterium]
MNLSGLRQSLRGQVLTPASPEYDVARRLWNAMIDRTPAAIVRCAGPDDVMAAIRFAAREELHPAIRAGGHNVAGLASVDEGLVIDVSRMKRIAVDPIARTVTTEPGLTWGEFDAATQAHGLATTGGINSTTGIAGLTLGGGVGWLMGRCGLTCDNTTAYSLVTADGELVTASAAEHSDLFWALKGGGGNFGVVTSITYRLHPVARVISGMILYPFARAHDVLRHYRDFVMAGVPDELTVFATAITSPDGVRLVAVVPAYSGPNLDEGDRVLAPLRNFGRPVADLVSQMPYVSLQQMFDAATPFGVRSYWKSTYLRGLPDDAIDAFVHCAADCPSPRTIIKLEHAHGAATRIASDATAFPARDHAFDLVVLSLWNDATDDVENIAWTREFDRRMHAWSARMVYVNALADDDAARVREAYGDNYARLSQVKTKYDPANRFRRNHNIVPAAPAK